MKYRASIRNRVGAAASAAIVALLLTEAVGVAQAPTFISASGTFTQTDIISQEVRFRETVSSKL